MAQTAIGGMYHFAQRTRNDTSRRVTESMKQLDIFVMMVRKHLLVMLRYPVEFITSFAQIFIIIVMFTLATTMFAPRDANELSGGGETRAGAVMMYGFIIFMFLSDMLWTIGYSVRDEQYQGTLESLYLTPASKFASLVSRVATIVVWTGGLTLAGVLFIQLFIGRLPFHNVGLAAYLLVMTISGLLGVGFAFAAYTLIVKESAQTMASLLQFILMILCGMFFPFSALPAPVGIIARLIPISYAVDIFRSTLMGYPPGFPELASPAAETALVTIFGFLFPLVGYWFYLRVERRVRTDGSLAEF